ncbi:dienelactone hydrolase family protein [Flavobacterium agrisoli]|uniref:Dienelactone hydrolase family protein n=1 Tax=Flavobacterium agrisoli TaxID=2793066 RepID=A0A934PKE6_9FLAO|nr:dienelactone hydrolase family protein [Flavobacterium agrisoli]MBK0368494.1 dienelactone hydrolase family protein [Flavobacterium agrisoli]
MKKLNLLLIFIMAISNSFAQLKPISYQDGSQKLNGLLASSAIKSKKTAGVLILPAWKGIDTSSKNIATELSKLGYTVFIADIYGEGNYPKDNTEAGKIAGFYKTNFTEYQKRIQLALNQLTQNGVATSDVVVIGYCFGGTGALEAARGHLNVKGVVSFHGGLRKDSNRANETNLSAKIMVCNGADDKSVTNEDILNFEKEMRDGKADWSFISYGNAVHSFTNPEAGNDPSKGNAYNEKAAKRSFDHLLLFLKETLY